MNMTIGSPVQRFRRPILSQLLDALIRDPVEKEENRHTLSLLSALLQDAARENASDVHLDPVEGSYQLRFRMDGALIDTLELAVSDGERLVRSFKLHAELDPAFAVLPQEGRAQFRLEDRLVAMRVTTAPSVLGEKLALRFLPTELVRLPLDQLGLSPGDYDQLSRSLHDARGMILVSGPTGSGKTTTLYALLHELKRTNRCIISIENPVERIIQGITQIQVNEKQGLTISEGVKCSLRLDPDIIMMGEVNDRASGRAALDVADSGHVFLSSLHARDAVATITTLRNFGLADHEIASTVDFIVAQRLVRRLCPECRKQEPPTSAEVNWLESCGQPVPELTWHAVGCPRCGHSGYRGRIGIFEVWRLQGDDVDLILNHTDEHTLRWHLRSYGTVSLIEDCLRKVAEGITSLDEIERIGGLGFFSSRATRAKPGPERAMEKAA